MLKYIAVTLVALVTIGLTVGDESRRQEVSRAGADPLLNFSFEGFAAAANVDIETTETPQSLRSEADAVAKALEAAKTYRATQEVRVTLRGAAPSPAPAAAAVEIPPAAAVSATEAKPASDLWYVTGTSVNIRSGPGTGNAVVTRASLGDEAEPLSDTGADWIEIRMSDGTTGWIFARFLSDAAPG